MNLKKLYITLFAIVSIASSTCTMNQKVVYGMYNSNKVLTIYALLHTLQKNYLLDEKKYALAEFNMEKLYNCLSVEYKPYFISPKRLHNASYEELQEFASAISLFLKQEGLDTKATENLPQSGRKKSMDRKSNEFKFEDLFDYGTTGNSSRSSRSSSTDITMSDGTQNLINKENADIVTKQQTKGLPIVFKDKKSPLHTIKQNQSKTSQKSHAIEDSIKGHSVLLAKKPKSIQTESTKESANVIDIDGEIFQKLIEDENNVAIMKNVLEKVKHKSSLLESACNDILTQENECRFYKYLQDKSSYGLIKFLAMWFDTPSKNRNVTAAVAETALKLEDHIMDYHQSLKNK
jgi:hypothetical protein